MFGTKSRKELEEDLNHLRNKVNSISARLETAEKYIDILEHPAKYEVGQKLNGNVLVTKRSRENIEFYRGAGATYRDWKYTLFDESKKESYVLTEDKIEATRWD